MGETSEVTTQTDPIQTPDNPAVGKEQIGRLMQIAAKVGDDFVSWTNKHVLSVLPVHDYGEQEQDLTVKYLVDRATKSPSINFLKKTIALVGLYDIGLTVAGLQMGVPKELIPIIWLSTFLGPVVDELSYRSRVIPEIATVIARRMGLDVRSDKARMLPNVIFSASHLTNSSINKFFIGGYLTKVANEKGLAASLATHSLINASLFGVEYLLVAAEKLTPTQAETAKAALLATLWTGLTTLGILGAKEMMDDRKMQNAIERLRSTDRIDKSLKIPEIKALYGKLLQYPSTRGYKFTTGVELAYITGMLESFENMHQPEMRDRYALEQVRRAITEFCPDSKKTEERVSLAFDYIDRQLKPKPQIIEIPASR